jgi:hypothetical protein
MAKPSQLVARRMGPSIITAWHTATPRHQNNGGDEVAVDHPTRPQRRWGRTVVARKIGSTRINRSAIERRFD